MCASAGRVREKGGIAVIPSAAWKKKNSKTVQHAMFAGTQKGNTDTKTKMRLTQPAAGHSS